MAGESRLPRGFTGALAGMIAALCCAVLVLVASGRGFMGGRGPTTVLEAICGPGGCRVMGRADIAHKGLDLHAAQQSLAQLHRGRHQQKKRSRAMRLQGLAVPDKNGWYTCGNGLCYSFGKEGRRQAPLHMLPSMLDSGPPMDLGMCTLP